MMLDIAVLLLMITVAYRIARSVREETLVLKEFQQTPVLALWVWLLPVGALVMAVGSFLLPFPATNLMCVMFYLPVLLIAGRQGHALGKAGTDRVRKAQSAVSAAWGTAMIGMIYLCAVTALQFVVTSIQNFK